MPIEEQPIEEPIPIRLFTYRFTDEQKAAYLAYRTNAAVDIYQHCKGLIDSALQYFLNLQSQATREPVKTLVDAVPTDRIPEAEAAIRALIP